MRRSRLAILAAAVLAAAVLAACETPPVTKEEMAGLNYGPKPVHWQDTIRIYLKLRLTDPATAILEFRTEPRVMYQRRTEVRDLQYGWAACVWVNDKNREGKYDGFYPMTFFIRDEKIVSVNNGPDDFGIIGATYARRQCKEMGAPFDG